MIDWLRTPLDPMVDLDGEDVPVVIRPMKRAKRLTLRLAPDGSEVRISLPPWASKREALAFAHARSDWLAKQRAALPRHAPPKPGGTLNFCGREVAIAWSPEARRMPELKGDTLYCGGPQDTLTKRLQRWLEKQALELMETDLGEYCAKIGKPPPRIALSRAQRRWGSCSDSGTVRINWRLVMASHSVRRSVVAHEVAHLVHFDHSPQFHALLDDIFEGDIAEANQWLKTHGRGLYSPFG